MGGAAMLGLGLALAQRHRRVLVITGDGEMLMGLGSLATIGPQHPRNLSIVVLDNERYGETGMQRSHTGRGVDLAAIARGAAFPSVTTVSTRPQLDAWLPTLHDAPGPVMTVVKVSAADAPPSVPLRDGTRIKNRFRDALLREEAKTDLSAFARHPRALTHDHVYRAENVSDVHRRPLV
jgi:thiamine pyrophosphate-dependent acetolactate synthase large subunit-like protein